jgi:hypothetical protein
LYLGPLLESASGSPAPTAIFVGEVSKDSFGHSVSSAGDVNGDGFDDVIIGAWDNGGGGGRSGRAYLFLGPLSGTIPAAAADVILTGGESGDEFGIAVSSAGDQDGNGKDDLLIGAAQFNKGDPGLAHVFLGESLSTAVPLIDGPFAPSIGLGFPNPTREAASFAARLEREGPLGMSIIDANGRRVRVYPQKTLGAGLHHLVWDGRDDIGQRVSNGVYFVRFNVGSTLTSRRVTMLR